jgi:hypothetical protein
MPKNPNAVSLGRLGGKAAAGKGMKNYWAKLTEEERAAEMSKRYKARKKYEQ